MAGISGIMIALSVALSGIAAALLTPVILDNLAALQRAVKIRNNLAGSNQGHRDRLLELLLADLCTNGVVFLSLPARLLCRLTVFRQLVQATQIVLAESIPGSNNRAIAEVLVASSVASALVCLLLSRQLFLALAGFLLLPLLVHFQVQKTLRDRKTRLRAQLPDALRGLSMCFMSGLSLEQAFSQTAEECHEPLRQELRRTVDDLKTGSSIEESLASLDARLAMDEMQFVAVALEIQHRSGGSMREVLESAASSLLASFDLSRSLEVQTSQARMSARIVSLLPVVLVVVLSIAMEGYLAAFFSSAAGLALLLVAVAMQVAGILAIRKILGIDLQ